MASRNSRDFEFTLGKLGLVIFSCGIALLLLSAFLFGVMVGKNIESYPEKIARGIPHAIKEKIAETSNEAISHIMKDDDSKSQGKSEKDDLHLTFYDSLTKKTDSTPIIPEKVEGRTKGPAKEKKTGTEVQFILQVASFKEKKRMETFRERLSALGYTPRISEINLASRGTWYRVCIEGFSTNNEAKEAAGKLEKDIRGVKCMILRKR